jgi:WD40 repeat protein/3',5'-cyclic AMP phosphodiesterase CpdA
VGSGEEPAVTILHVSDVQFGKHHRFADPGGGFDTLLARLRDDLDVLARDHALRPDLIALTGDLTEWGMKAEFDQVAGFAEGLRAHLGLEPDRLLVIPGNHDINRKRCESYFLRCESDCELPRPPYWPKWEPYTGLISRLYRDVDRYRFTELEPWTLFEIPSLSVVVAGLNSTIGDSHRDEDHHGFVGEPQLRWFADRLVEYEARDWLRVGIVHHNAVRRAAVDDENLKDADDLRETLGDRLHLLLHGHTHQGRVEMLGPSLPVIATGSAAVRRDQRPGPSAHEAGETPNQYQIVRLTRDGLRCFAREYTYERKRWIGDTRVSKHGDVWWYEEKRTWPRAEATFPPPVSAVPGDPPHASTVGDVPSTMRAELQDPLWTRSEIEATSAAAWVRRGHEDDLLDDVVSWCRIRGEGRLVEVTRVRHRGPWGDYAKVHDRDRGIGLLGTYHGELTAEVLDRWIADVHDPFRGRGQPVSRLVVASVAIDPALRDAAQVRGVEVERMVDYQRVLDTAGYADRLRERLARDREYPHESYLEQRMTVWNPVHASSERLERAADWLVARLLEREGVFVLALGPAGVGKTFLLREVARRLGAQQAITPILVELRDLERAHTIEELAATQFTRFGVPWHPRAFRRDLEDGRLALLFDGFDELALRVRSAAIPVHFERIYGAAVERARIAVTSRTEHFLSSGQVADLMTPSSAATTPLGGQLERVSRRLVLEVHPFERGDIAEYLRRRLGDPAGEARLARLAGVHDLVGLARNPRMLGFLIDIPDDKLARATGLGDSITSDALYRLVIDDGWLPAEARRLSPPGAAPGPNAAALRDAATHLALQLWRDPGGSIRAEDIAAHTGALLARMCDDDPDWTAHTARARTLLTRDDQGRIGFIHQTVLEWLVADRVAGEITGELPAANLDVGRLNAFMIDLLRERIGDDTLARWAEARLAPPTTDAATENARDVLRRLGREADVRAVHRDQDLRGQELGGQSLRQAILDRADLTGARLVGRDLTGASLIGAQLVYADLSDACLEDVDLSGANLAFARLHRTELRGARLTGARLTGASLLGARNLPSLDVADAIGAVTTAPMSIDLMITRAPLGGCRAAISPDGSVLASAHGDGAVRVWDARGRLVRIVPADGGRLLTIAISPDGANVATGAEDGVVRLWSAADEHARELLVRHTGRVFSVAFSPDGRTLASGGEDGTIRLWTPGRERARLAGYGGRVLCVAFSPDGITLASCAADGGVRLWNAANGRARAVLASPDCGIRCLAFSPDGATLVTGGNDALVRLWSVADGREFARLAGHAGRVLCVAFSPDGATVASGAEDDTVRLWSAADGRESARFVDHGGRVLSVAFSPDGSTLVSGAEDDTIRMRSTVDGRERGRLIERSGSVLGVAFSPDGSTLASCGPGNAIRLWDLRSGSEQARLTSHEGYVHCVAFSPDGQAMASGSADSTIRVWNRADGREHARHAWPGGAVWSVAFSPDGQTVARADDDTVQLWNVRRGDHWRFDGHGGRVWSVAFSPDGQTVASGGADGIVRFWSAQDGHERARSVGLGGPVYGVAFAPDGAMVASASHDGVVRMWGVDPPKGHGYLPQQAGSVLCVAFSPDGALLASGGTDAKLRMWSLADGRESARLHGHGGTVFSAAFSPDGRTLASSASDGTVRLWDVASSRCLAILCGTPGGTLAARPDGRYRVRGDIGGRFWHVIGLHRYDVGELDALVPGLRLADDEPLYTRE